MDFGIKAALMTALRTIEQVSRGTGRSTWAIDNALSIGRENGRGCVIFTGPAEAERITRMIDRIQRDPRADATLAGLRFHVVGIAHADAFAERVSIVAPGEAIVLDHLAIELMYEAAIQRVDGLIHEARKRAFPSGRVGYLPSESFGRALYAFGEREESLGPIRRDERSRRS